jgi:hypothetical protein
MPVAGFNSDLKPPETGPKRLLPPFDPVVDLRPQQ